jgi:hypothetical protein
MLARDPLGIVQVWSERLEEGKQAVVGAETGALVALVLELSERCLIEREVGMQVAVDPF